jgi:hypothetical protein
VRLSLLLLRRCNSRRRAIVGKKAHVRFGVRKRAFLVTVVASLENSPAQ